MSSPRVTFLATLPDGAIARRTSDVRTYTHAVAARDAAGNWYVEGFAGSAELARKAMLASNAREEFRTERRARGGMVHTRRVATGVPARPRQVIPVSVES